MHWSKSEFLPRPVFRAIAAFAGSLAAVLTTGAQSAPPAPSARFVVVLDAAHGGGDLGGRLGGSQLEKAATLALSVRLRSLLAARGIAVVTTRESDATIPPEKRSEIANHANAQACFTLHATESGAGIHLFVSSLAPAQAVRFSPWKTAQAAWVSRSLALAGAVNAALLHTGVNVTLGRTGLAAMDSMTCPAVAVEIAPQRGPDNAITAEPNDADYQARVAAAVAAAVLEWRTDAGRTEVRQP